MGISAANIIIQGDPVVRDPDGEPVRTMEDIRSMARQQAMKKIRVVDEPLIEHRHSAFHADMLRSNKHK